MFTYYNSLYAEYAWRVVKATYGMVAVSWPVYGALLLLLNQIWTRPTFLPSLLLLLLPPPASLQNSICESSGDPGVLFNGCLASGQKLPERVSTHSQFWSCSS